MEKSAWNITRQLVQTFEEEQTTLPPEKAATEPVPESFAAPAAKSVSSPDPAPAGTEEARAEAPVSGEEPESGVDPVIRRAFALLLSEDFAGFAEHAKANSLLPLTLVERMNEMALEELDDIAVEDTGEGFALIEDYKEDIKRWMNL